MHRDHKYFLVYSHTTDTKLDFLNHSKWRTLKPKQANTYSACSILRVVVSIYNIKRDANRWVSTFIWMRMVKRKGWRMGGDGKPLVSWLGRIRAVWDRSDLTQPSFSRTGHVRLDLSHTTDIIPLSGETTAHHHSTADGGERAGGRAGGHKVSEKKARRERRWVRLQYTNRCGGAVVRLGGVERVLVRGSNDDWISNPTQQTTAKKKGWPEVSVTIHKLLVRICVSITVDCRKQCRPNWFYFSSQGHCRLPLKHI